MTIAVQGILYSFRRCPYAIRARMVLRYAGVKVELREVLLKDKPQAMIDISPKATVPVLYLTSPNEDREEKVLDESRDIMLWALQNADPEAWYYSVADKKLKSIDTLITQNDEEFKPWLDKYKYSIGYPEHDQTFYRDRACEFLNELEVRLNKSAYLLDDTVTLADIAIFPFVRQFAFVDKHWFDASSYDQLKLWLLYFLELPLFSEVMVKYPVWDGDSEKVIF